MKNLSLDRDVGNYDCTLALLRIFQKYWNFSKKYIVSTMKHYTMSRVGYDSQLKGHSLLWFPPDRASEMLLKAQDMPRADPKPLLGTASLRGSSTSSCSAMNQNCWVPVFLHLEAIVWNTHTTYWLRGSPRWALYHSALKPLNSPSVW